MIKVFEKMILSSHQKQHFLQMTEYLRKMQQITDQNYSRVQIYYTIAMFIGHSSSHRDIIGLESPIEPSQAIHRRFMGDS